VVQLPLRYNPPIVSTRTPPPAAFFPLAIVLVLLGVGGLFLIFSFALPTLGPRWLFFFLIVCALTGIALPLTAFLNYRFPSSPPATQNVIVRQALWVGIYGTTLAWLQYGRVFNSSLAVILFAGFFAIEMLLRLWERSQFRKE